MFGTMLSYEELIDESLKSRKKIYQANKTICTLCNYITKNTQNKAALKKADIEFKKAKKAMEKVEEIDKLLKKLTEMNCERISKDPNLTEEEKSTNINGLRETQKEFSVNLVNGTR